ncbi:YdcF family protein [Synechococcales cyanobacterium C]|uniref:YdcF family protein n=2 Tax=Petrachloros TaxID=2918834 RepID=A0A8K2A0A3_9CYAN|nr:YdcF family protein [Petrachloros mirabilis]NCJ06997.1 YdcF family protein [Petrachloros mirabilis ULC683]
MGLALWLHHPAMPPQGVLVLGGEPQREKFAAAFAQEYPQLPIWVSSGSNPEYAEWVFAEAGISSKRFHLDYQAVDTLTNFTTLVDDLKAEGIESLYLITSDYHMRRARLVGQVVMGSRGIQLHAIAIPSEEPAEPLEKAVADGLRALWWLATGSTGETWRQEFSQR